MKRGGSWITAGLWAIGDVHAARSTFHNNGGQQFAADKKGEAEAKIALQQCLVSCEGTNAAAGRLYNEESRVTRTDTAEWMPPTGTDPQYVGAAAAQAWAGEPPDAFDSSRFGPAQGYSSAVAAKWRAQSPAQLIEVARTLLKASSWDDFTNRAAQIAQPAGK